MVMIILKSLVLPVLAGGGTIALCWLLPPLRKWKWLSASAFGLAIAVSSFGAWFAEKGVPDFPPTEMAGWLGIMAVLAAVAAILIPCTGKKKFPAPEIEACVMGVIVASAPTIAVMMGGTRDHYFADMAMADHLAMGMAVAIGFLIFERIAERQPGFILPLIFTIVFGALAPMADAAGWITLTFFCASISGACFIATLASKFGGSPSIGRGGVAAAVLLLVVCPVAAYRQGYPDFPWWSLLLVAGSPLVLLLLEVCWLDKLPPWLLNTMRIVSVLVLVGIGLYTGLVPGGEAELDPMLMYE